MPESLSTDIALYHGEHLVFARGKQALTSSLVVAEVFKKRHADVIRAVQKIIGSGYFNERNFAFVDEFNGISFEPVEYKDSKGENRPMYFMTRDGFMLLVMGFTGDEAMRWKIKFIALFNKLEQSLRGQFHPDVAAFDAFGRNYKRASLFKSGKEDRLLLANELTLKECGRDLLAEQGYVLERDRVDPEVKRFWQVFKRLNNAAGQPMNHSNSPNSKIAINAIHFNKACRQAGIETFDFKRLRTLFFAAGQAEDGKQVRSRLLRINIRCLIFAGEPSCRKV